MVKIDPIQQLNSLAHSILCQFLKTSSITPLIRGGLLVHRGQKEVNEQDSSLVIMMTRDD